MLRPSYSQLMNILNGDSNSDNKITSRYSIVIAVAKRARQIIDGAPVYTDVPPDKAVSAAVDEMRFGRIKTFPDMEHIPESYKTIDACFPNKTATEKKPKKERRSGKNKEKALPLELDLAFEETDSDNADSDTDTMREPEYSGIIPDLSDDFDIDNYEDNYRTED